RPTAVLVARARSGHAARFDRDQEPPSSPAAAEPASPKQTGRLRRLRGRSLDPGLLDDELIPDPGVEPRHWIPPLSSGARERARAGLETRRRRGRGPAPARAGRVQRRV